MTALIPSYVPPKTWVRNFEHFPKDFLVATGIILTHDNLEAVRASGV
jgi:hypothetical protein